jgi:hypothetical protein
VRKFELYNPIRMIFGTGEFERLGEVARQYGKKPLVVFGRSHARTCGILDKGIDILKKAGLDPVVFEGVEPNPSISTCRDAALLAKKNKCDMVVGIGGGSVMDASKLIAFGFFDPDNIWNYVAYWEPGYKPVKEALPIVLVSTLAATGSEGDSGAVVTNDETMEKAGVAADPLFPKASIIDPNLTMTVSADYTRDGAIDMMLHVLEGYFNEGESSPFADRCTEAFVVEVMLALESVIENPTDSDARGQLSYLAAIALNGFINRPRGGAFPMHSIQHPMSAYFNISHGRGLALLLPRWLRYVSRDKPDKIIQFGERVFAMALETYHPFEAADRTIDRLEEWLEGVGAWFYLEDFGIPNDPGLFQEMAQNAIRIYGDENGLIPGTKPLSVDDIVTIYKNCVRLGVPETETVMVIEAEEEPAGDSETPVDEEVIEEVVVIEGEIPEGAEGEYEVVEEIVIEEVEDKKEGE